MDRKADRRVRTFIQKIRKKFDIKQAILFGSRARGDNLEYSDYDILLVSPKFKGVFFSKRAAQFYDFWPYDYDLELLCYTPEEFEEMKRRIGIVRKAVKEGITLV